MNPHFIAILKAFHDEGVEYLVIGAHALAAHGHVRALVQHSFCISPVCARPCRAACDAAQLFRLVRPFHSNDRTAYLASTLMHNVRQDSAKCVESLEVA